MPNPNFGAHHVRGAPGSQAPQYHIEPIGQANVWMVDGTKFSGCPGAQERLTGGFYSCAVDQYGRPQLNRMEISIDNLIRLPDPICDMLLAEFVTFWDHVDVMEHELLLAVKRGIILWGPPGSGKTSAVHTMASHMIREKKGVVIMAQRPEITTACLHMFRKIEPKRPAIVVYEDLDSLVETYGESGYLSMLDGETQISDVVNIATTNYPERLDPRFVDRPGRFDRVEYMGMPSAEARTVYLKTRLPEIDDVTLHRWVAKSEGWSIAHLREMIVATRVLKEGDSTVIKRLNRMREELATSDDAPDGRAGIGFATKQGDN